MKFDSSEDLSRFEEVYTSAVEGDVSSVYRGKFMAEIFLVRRAQHTFTL